MIIKGSYDNTEDYKETIRLMRRGALRMPREGFSWSQEEKDVLAQLFEDSIGITETAVLLERTEEAIIQQIEKQKLYDRHTTPSRRHRAKKDPCCLCDRCPIIGQDCCPILQASQKSGEDD